MTTALEEIQGVENNVWTTNGNKGNSGATGLSPIYKITPAPPYTVFEGDPQQAYNNPLWNQRLADAYPQFRDAMLSASRFVIGFRVLIKPEDFPWTRAVEFELEHTDTTPQRNKFNMAWQARTKTGSTWRYFDIVHRAWLDSGIPVTIQPGVEQHIFADFQKSGTSMTHVALNVDNLSHAVNVTQPALPTLVQRPKLNVSFQLDAQNLQPGGKLPPPTRASVQQMNVKFGA